MKRSWAVYIVVFLTMVGLLVLANRVGDDVLHEVKPGEGAADGVPDWVLGVLFLLTLLGVHFVAMFAATPSWRRRALYVTRVPWSVLGAALFLVALVLGPPLVFEVVVGIAEGFSAAEQGEADAAASETVVVVTPHGLEDTADVPSGDEAPADETSGDETSGDEASGEEAAPETMTRLETYVQLALPLVYAAIVAVMVIVMRSRGRNAWRGLGFVRGRLWRDIGIGIVAYVAFTFAILPVLGTAVAVLFDVLGLAVKEHTTITDYREAGSPLVRLALIQAIVFTAPVFEEIAFRGVLLQTIKRYAGSAAAIGISTLVFAAVHPGLFVIANIFFLGLLFAYLFDKTGSIVPSIVVHFLFNGTSMFFVMLAS